MSRMPSIILLLSITCCIATGSFFPSDLSEEWESFKALHGKSYKNEAEESMRRDIWEDRYAQIARHNLQYDLGEKSFRMAMNKFGDMKPEEVRQQLNGFKKPTSPKRSSTFLPPLNSKLPDSVDWREKGYVTPVKNQGNCGSCWAFSATGALEGQWFRKTGTLYSLSEQELIDCSTKQGNFGCRGGYMDDAFQYVQDNEIEQEKDYPYIAQDQECWDDPNKKVVSDRGFVNIPEGDEASLQSAVAAVGPISVAIDASQDSFLYYAGGVYDEPACTPDDLDHGVLVVGFGAETNGTEYYIVKNSWGPDWGEKGYIRMSRNKKNQCGIATLASYPVV